MKRRILRTLGPLSALLLVLVTVCTLALPLASASALTTLDPNELFYITGAVSKTEISEADAGADGNYTLAYTATATMPDLLGEYITTYSKYVTDFTFQINVYFIGNLVPDTSSVKADCAFGDVTGVTVDGGIMTVSVGIKSGTSLQDYTYDQWVSPIYLSFNATLAGDNFVDGGQLNVSMSVDGTVSGYYFLVGDLSVNVHGTMDPANPEITTNMVSGSQSHAPEDPTPPTPSPSKTIDVEVPSYVPSFIIDSIPTVKKPAGSASSSAAASGSVSSSSSSSGSASGSAANSAVSSADSELAAAISENIRVISQRILIGVIAFFAVLVLIIVLLVVRHRRKKKKSGSDR